MSERLDDARIQQYLAGKDVVVLATLLPSGRPLLTPMWFVHDANALTMISVDGLVKVANMRRDPRVSVVAESGTRRDIQSVTVQGRATFLSDTPERRAAVARLLDKYAPDLERLWGGPALPSNRVVFRIVPDRVRSHGLSA